MNGEERPKRAKRATVFLSVACVGLAMATTTLAVWNRGFKRQLEDVAGELDDLTKRLARALNEKEALRDENKSQEAVIEMQREKRDAAEKRAQLAEKRAKHAETIAKTEKKRADDNEQRALAAETLAAKETARADEEKSLREVAQTENARLKEREAAASQRNLGDALADLARLEDAMPRHAGLEEEDERVAFLKYDCSLLRRLMYDFNDGRGDDVNARTRREELEARYTEDCSATR